ncbi:MAG TPA: NUDIX domain-containing protein [Nocardioidaceae bacterium]|nr:NUDIX domain-containing protein [Nocardioidaceae bacterium]
MIDRFVVVPAAYVLFLRRQDGADQVLLQLRQNTGYRDGHWAAAAAGHVEKGESVFAAARREALEEVGVRLEDLQPVCAMHRTDAADRAAAIDERVDYFFTSRAWSGTPQIREPDKCAELRWFDLAALPDPVVPHEKVVLEGVAADGVPPIVTYGFPD